MKKSLLILALLISSLQMSAMQQSKVTTEEEIAVIIHQHVEFQKNNPHSKSTYCHTCNRWIGADVSSEHSTSHTSAKQ